ncbi:MAG: hypothetical protein RLZZ169_1020 [Pseudomonadota bacterium]|jgi:hypothetical protein
MPINDRTTARSYAKPNAANLLSEDVERLREALDSIDTDVAALIVDVLTKAATASPEFTGTPTAPTAATDTDTTQIATTAFVKAQTSADNPAAPGTAAAGVSSRYARADHVHPRDTTKAPLESPEFTGTPTAPTAPVDTNTTQLATTGFVVGQGYVKQTRQTFAGTGLTGGGDLSANRTFAADIATQAEAEAGTSSTKLMTPQRTAQAITARRATQVEAEAGTNTTQLMTPERTAQAIAALGQQLKLDTAKTASNSGVLEFTGLPSWVKRITLIINGLSCSTGARPLIQLGSGTFQTSGYSATAWSFGRGDESDGGGFIFGSGNSVDSYTGQFTFTLLTGNVWIGSGIVRLGLDDVMHLAGGITLSGVLDRIRLVVTPAFFDAGAVNILYEG